MRVDLIILFASCALAASSSNASNVRRNPISSAIVQSVAESQQGLPVNRLLRDHEAIIDEERWPNLKNLFQSKASRWSKLEDEAVLKPFLTKEDGTPATASEILQHKEFSILVQAFKKKPNGSLMAMLSGERGDKDVTMALYRLKESGRLDDEVAVELMNEQFSYLHLKADGYPKRVFDIVLETNNPENPISMFNGEIEVLEDYLMWRYRKSSILERKRSVAKNLIPTLVECTGGEVPFMLMVSTHYKNPEAQLLEEKFVLFLLMKYDDLSPLRGLFWYAKLWNIGVELLNNHEVLNMMGRFYLYFPGSQIIPDVTTKVKALKEAFGEYRAALLISKAVEDENLAIKSVGKELEIEYFKQVKLNPDYFQQWALRSAENYETGHDTIGKFIERYLEFERNKRKELNGGEGGLVAST